MKIAIDIGHPAHVHYFKNFIKIMQDKGHEFFISARNRKYVKELLDANKINYSLRTNGSSNLFLKFLNIPIIDYQIFRLVRKFNPDFFISSKSIYLSHVAKILGKPYVVITDTEVSFYEDILSLPFIDYLITPKDLKKNFKKKHIRVDSYFELTYLNPKYYTPDRCSLRLLNIKEGIKYFIIRLVSWEASHDKGQVGLNSATVEQLIELLSVYGKVFISSESELPDQYKHLELNIPFDKMHDVLAFAELIISEGATIASEAGILGTPAIYVNSLERCYNEDQEKYNTVFNFRNSNGVVEKVKELLDIPDLKEKTFLNSRRIINDKIDLTSFLVWFVNGYPDTLITIKNEPYYVDTFK